MFEYADGTVLEFATRGQDTNDEGTQKIGNLFYGTEGWVWIDGDGAKWQAYHGAKDDKGEGADLSAEESGGGSDPNVLTSIEFPHYQNFVDAHARERSEDPDVRYPRRASVVDAAASREYRLPHQALP